jgi:hypothetical protein
MTTMEGTVSVSVGNIVAIKIDMTRQFAFDTFVMPLQIEGFDSTLHKFVIPQTPFKPGTTEHWDDKGLHITVAQHGRDIGSGVKDVVDETSMIVHETNVPICFDVTSFCLLEGTPANDDAVGCVYYIGVNLDASTNQRVNDIRAKLNLPVINATPHLSIGGIDPIDGDRVAFRKKYCPPRPSVGFPLPLKHLTIQ